MNLILLLLSLSFFGLSAITDATTQSGDDFAQSDDLSNSMGGGLSFGGGGFGGFSGRSFGGGGFSGRGFGGGSFGPRSFDPGWQMASGRPSEDDDINRGINRMDRLKHPNTMGIPPRRWWNPFTWPRYLSPRPEDRTPPSDQQPNDPNTLTSPATSPAPGGHTTG